MSELKPFKAHFEYSFRGQFKDAFDKTVWSRIFYQNSERDTKTIIHDLSVGFNIPYNKKGTKINLDFDQIHSVYPEKVKESDYGQSVEFKFNSKPIEVLQIVKDEITFSNDSSVIHTITLSDELLLRRD